MVEILVKGYAGGEVLPPICTESLESRKPPVCVHLLCFVRQAIPVESAVPADRAEGPAGHKGGLYGS